MQPITSGFGIAPAPESCCPRRLLSVMQFCGLLVLNVALLCKSTDCSAATNAVTTLDDSGPGSLRGVIESSLPGDTIVFAATGTVYLIRGELLLSRDVTIAGPGNSAVTIDAVGNNRIFNVDPGVNAWIRDLALRGGKARNGTNGAPNDGQATPGEAGKPGGGIYNAGSLVLERCVIQNCAAGQGGNGVSFSGPWLGTPSAGGAGGDGGGIFNLGTLRATNCVIALSASGSAGGSGFTTYSPPPAAAGKGGGICNSGTVILSHVVFTNNSTGSGGGGGIGGNGSAGGSGGGLWNEGSAVAEHCVFAENSTAGGSQGGAGKPNGGAGGQGGSGAGIYSPGPLRVFESIFGTNWCGMGGQGGGASMTPAGGGGGGGDGAALHASNAELVGCSFIGNRAGSGGGGGGSSFAGGSGGGGGRGGGVYCNLALRMTNCTLVGNASGSGGPAGSGGMFPGVNGQPGYGGGICVGGSTQTVVACTLALNQGGGIAGSHAQILGCLVAQNTGENPDAAGELTSLGYNLVSRTNGSTGFNASTDIVGNTNNSVEAKLGELGANGGFGPTLALLPGSRAMDAGGDLEVGFDQRGVPRPQARGVDIGAYEHQFTTPYLLAFPMADGTNLHLVGYSLPGKRHLYQVSTNWSQWQDLSAIIANQEGTTEMTINMEGTGPRWYRLAAQE